MKLSYYPKVLKETSLNYFRSLFFTPKNSKECFEIINTVFTDEERYAIGRRIQIVDLFVQGFSYKDIESQLKTSRVTVSRALQGYGKNPDIYKKIIERYIKDEKTLSSIQFNEVGGSLQVFKKKLYNKDAKNELPR